MADQKLSALNELAAEPASDDEVYIRDVSEIASAESKRITVANLIAGAGGAADFPMKLKPNFSRWVLPGWFSSTFQEANAAANRIYYIPIFVEETTTYIRICIYVATSSAGNADLRIFNWSDGVPGTLVLSAGTVDTGTTGAKEITISQQLTRGYYFLAVRNTGTPGCYGLSTSNAISPPLAGIKEESLAATPNLIPYVDTTYNDPAPAPTAATIPIRAIVYLREN